MNKQKIFENRADQISKTPSALNESLQVALEKELESKVEQWPQHVNRISSLGDSCTRKLVYARTHWDQAIPTDTGLQGVFETGTTLEPIIENILTMVGLRSNPRFRVTGKQNKTRDAFLERYKIHGTIDGVIETYRSVMDGADQSEWNRYGVVDIKTCSPYIFSSLHTADDLNKYSWTRKYKGQLMLYALAEELEHCVIVFVNKTNIYQMKIIEFPLDYEYTETLIKKAELINEVVDGKAEMPPHINDVSECKRCPFFHVCMPPLESTGNLEVLTDQELIDLVQRRKELKVHADQFNQIDKELKSRLVKGQDLIAGDTIIQWSAVKRKSYTVAASEYQKIKFLDTDTDSENNAN